MAEKGTLHDAFIEERRDTYDAERQLTQALAKLAGAATAPELRDAFESPLGETKGQIDRLERVFENLEERARGKHCEGIAGIIEESQSIMGEVLPVYRASSTGEPFEAAASRAGSLIQPIVTWRDNLPCWHRLCSC